jgi:hypothetical protein
MPTRPGFPVGKVARLSLAGAEVAGPWCGWDAPGHVIPSLFAPATRQVAALTDGRPGAAAFLIGESGLRLLEWKLARDADVAQRLFEVVAGNLHTPPHSAADWPPRVQDCHGASGIVCRLAPLSRSVPDAGAWDRSSLRAVDARAASRSATMRTRCRLVGS